MKLRDRRPVFKMTLIALSLALYIALSFVSLDLRFFRITASGFAVMFIAVCYGPIEGAAVGFLGELVYQAASFGFTPTTFFWLLAPAVRGLVVGLMFKQKSIKKHPILWIITVAVSCVAVTIVNTFALEMAVILEDWSQTLTFVLILTRFGNSLLYAIAYAILFPLLFTPLIKAGKFETEKDSD